MSNEFAIKRVAYGKADTPENMKEYCIHTLMGGPVGTVDDWKKFAHDYDTLKIIELDGSVKKVKI